MPVPDGIERLTRVAQEAAVRLHVRSALNPMLWLCGIVSIVSFGIASRCDGFMQQALIVIGAIPVLTTCGAYVYLMLKAPDRLHSEDYQIRRQALGMIYEKGMPSGMLASSVLAIANPNAPKPKPDQENPM